jgi:ubiquinone/menaquinone biosynthesis C-methylase UbiE
MTDHQVPSDDWLVGGGGGARDVADHYDAWAESYDGDLDTWSYRAPRRVAESVLADRPEARSVLDVGCGTGLVGRSLRALGYTGRLTGFDISEQSLEVAGRSGDYEALRAADLQQPLPADDDSVDVAVCVGVMTYLPDTEAVWRELVRVTRPGGLVAVTQREDLWVPRECQRVIDLLTTEGAWTPIEVSGPEPYLPDADGALGGLGAYYVTAEVVGPAT